MCREAHSQARTGPLERTTGSDRPPAFHFPPTTPRLWFFGCVVRIVDRRAVASNPRYRPNALLGVLGHTEGYQGIRTSVARGSEYQSIRYNQVAGTVATPAVASRGDLMRWCSGIFPTDTVIA